MRETKVVHQMALNPMRRGISTRPTTSTIQSFAEVQMVLNGRQSHTTHASYGLTRSALQMTDIFTSQLTSCIAKLAFIKDMTYAASPIHYFVSASMVSLYCCDANECYYY